MQKITPCLWFNDQAEEAARFYISIFKNSTIGEITHYGEGSPRPKGSVLTVRFQLDGGVPRAQRRTAIHVYRGRVVHGALRDAGGTRPDVGAAVRGR